MTPTGSNLYRKRHELFFYLTPAGLHNSRGKQTPMFYADVQPRWGWDGFGDSLR
jgi:hypothetical protein